MKRYPSIELVKAGQTPPDRPLYTFDKLDGSNIRFEWSRKKGWHKSGMRARLVGKDDEHFAEAETAIDLFHATMGGKLSVFCKEARWQEVTAFVEFYGRRSFAGLHHPEDEKHVALLDLTYDKKGFLPPDEYLKLVEETGVPAPNYLGLIKWNKSFLWEVEARGGAENPQFDMIDLITFEGIVGKTTEKKRRLMWKFKTKAWREAIADKFGHGQALDLIAS
jgi:hypothetical protein